MNKNKGVSSVILLLWVILAISFAMYSLFYADHFSISANVLAQRMEHKFVVFQIKSYLDLEFRKLVETKTIPLPPSISDKNIKTNDNPVYIINNDILKDIFDKNKNIRAVTMYVIDSNYKKNKPISYITDELISTGVIQKDAEIVTKNIGGITESYGIRNYYKVIYVQMNNSTNSWFLLVSDVELLRDKNDNISTKNVYSEMSILYKK
ncbi:MAG: hypothetical protein RR370_02250 [Synergistaceae bacterium]